MTMSSRLGRGIAAVAALLVILGSVQPGVRAQQPGAERSVSLTTGRSTILTTDFDVTRIAVTNPAVADATVVRPREILIDGKAPGTISLIIWGTDQRQQYDVIVEQPISPLEQQLHQLFPGEDVTVTSTADAVVLSGKVSNTQIMLRIGVPEVEHHQHAAGGGRHRRAAGDAAGAHRGSEPQGH